MRIEIQNPLYIIKWVGTVFLQKIKKKGRNRKEKDQNIKKVYYKRSKKKIYTFFSITLH